MSDSPAPTTTPMAGDGEESVSGNNMKGSPGLTMKGDTEADPHAALEALAEKVQSAIPLGLSDGDAAKLGREIEARYLPPLPNPTVIEQLEAMKAPPSPPPQS